MIPNTREVRRRRVLHARERLAGVAERRGVRSLVLTSSAAVAWATGAISTPIDRVAPSDPIWVVYREGDITLVTSSVEVERIRQDYPLDELGFTLVAAPWYEENSHQRLAREIAGENCAFDVTGFGADASFALMSARLGLCEAEMEVLQGLAMVATDAVEGAVEGWEPGQMNDFEIAAYVARHLETQGADAVCLIAGGDERLARFRHPIMNGSVPASSLMVVVVARSLGLHVALTRLASERDDPRREQREKLLEQCDIVNDHVREATRVGATWGQVYGALAKGYAAVGQPEAWREHFQGGPIGYAQREFELSPLSASSPWWNESIPVGCATAFNPSLAGGAKIEDTFLVGPASLTCLTSSVHSRRLEGVGSGTTVFEAREKKET